MGIEELIKEGINDGDFPNKSKSLRQISCYEMKDSTLQESGFITIAYYTPKAFADTKIKTGLSKYCSSSNQTHIE